MITTLRKTSRYDYNIATLSDVFSICDKHTGFTTDWSKGSKNEIEYVVNLKDEDFDAHCELLTNIFD